STPSTSARPRFSPSASSATRATAPRRGTPRRGSGSNLHACSSRAASIRCFSPTSTAPTTSIAGAQRPGFATRCSFRATIRRCCSPRWRRRRAISTYSTSYYPPFHTAKLFSSLDHFTEGRVGWNIVTSYLASACRNGMGEMLPHDRRYERAEEYMEVVYKLWEASWEEDAVVRDSTRDIHTDPARVRAINHKGKYFEVAGPHMCEPSPQRTPLLLQAGQSGRGIAFGARHGEALFVTYPTIEAARVRVARIRSAIRAEGRDPDHVKLLLGLAVVVAETDEEARLKESRLRSYASPDGAFALFGGWTGIDLAQFRDDEPLDRFPSEGIKAAARWFSAAYPGRMLTLADAREEMKLASLIPLVVGDPIRVADEVERWVDETGIDGLNLVPIYQPGSFAEFIDLVVPELHRRGRLRTSYEGKTLREHLFGAGQRRLLPDHPAYRIARIPPRQ